MSALHIATLLAAALAAGLVDAVVGGGGLIMLPALLVAFPTTPVATLLGTNKFTAIAGTCTAAVTYLRRNPVNWRILGPIFGLAVLGSAAGGLLAGAIPPSVYRPILIVVLALVALIVVLRPQLGTVLRHDIAAPRHRVATAVTLAGVALSVYDGMIGPGTGTFLLLTFTATLGVDFLRASTMAKVVNVGTNLGALLIFAAGGHVLWLLGLGTATANMVGARLGAHLAQRRGARFIRAALLTVVFALLAKLGYDQFG